MMKLFKVAVRCLFIAICISQVHAQVAGPYDAVYRTAPNYRGGTDTLHVKWWMPADVGSNKLPLIVWIHGGAFYAGNYVDMTSNCKRWAEEGYVAVSVQYRLGFWGNLFDPPYAYDRSEIVRAAWRGMQDVRIAIRMLCSGTLVPNIDTSCVIVAGESAGSILTLQAIVADVADSVPAEVDSIASAVRGFDTYPRPSLGDVDGFPFNSKRVVIPMPHISGIINHYGGLLHPYMLDAAVFPPLFSYHQKNDPIVACGVNRGLYGMPLGVGDNYPVLTGTCALVTLLEELGHPESLRETIIVEGANHQVDNGAAVYPKEFEFARNVMCPNPTGVIDDPDVPVSCQPNQWTVIDILGQVMGNGEGGVEAAQAWIGTTNIRAAFVVVGNQVHPAWKLIR